MSFFCNFQSDRCPGQITGNPLNGLCEKVCIQVKKVFDACMQQQQLTGVVLNLTNFTPANPTYPLTFISARSTTARGTISNLLIDPIADKPNSARVRADVTIPVTVAYTDANGVEGVATSSFTVTKDVILCVPAPSVMPESASRRTFPSSALTACPSAGTTSRGSPPLRSRSRSWRKRATPCCST